MLRGGGLAGRSTKALASGLTEDMRLCHWVVAPDRAKPEPALPSAGEAEGEAGNRSGSSASSWATEDTCLCHCVVAPEGVYRGAAGLLLACGGS